ncbi:MAG: hypothetical protein U0792_17170 [Gemmataceae bacterium]
MLWTDAKHLRGLMAQPLYRDGHVFTIDKDFGLTCFELKGGRNCGTTRTNSRPKGRNPHASIVWLNDGDRALAQFEQELVLYRLNARATTSNRVQRCYRGKFGGTRRLPVGFAKTDGGGRGARPDSANWCVSRLAGEK